MALKKRAKTSRLAKRSKSARAARWVPLSEGVASRAWISLEIPSDRPVRPSSAARISSAVAKRSSAFLAIARSRIVAISTLTPSPPSYSRTLGTGRVMWAVITPRGVSAV